MMVTLGLDEEIAMYQFAQGVQSEADLVEQLNQLDEPRKMRQFLHMNTLVRQLKPVDADVQQALADNSLTTDDFPGMFIKADRLQIGTYDITNLQEGDYEKAYAFLLYLFKVLYQQRATSDNSTNWRYWDLANLEVVQRIRTRHQETVEAVYANASFRSEFVSIAKLWHERDLLIKAKSQEPEPERQTRFTFLNYDEVITESLKIFSDKYKNGIRILHHSLEKALSKQYELDAGEAQRVVFEVIERHLRETYNTDLF